MPDYVFFADDDKFKTLMLFGDHLTVERARSAQRARVAANTIEDSASSLQLPIGMQKRTSCRFVANVV